MTTSYTLHHGDALDAYPTWPTPTVIISDGAYGLSRFPGDPTSVNGLVDWYAPHITAWSTAADPATARWVWNTEIGWATIHPLLAETGWDYVQAVIWDKGPGHIAGRVNSSTIRRFPSSPRPRASTSATPSSRPAMVQDWKETGSETNGPGTGCRCPRRTTRAGCGARRLAST